MTCILAAAVAISAGKAWGAVGESGDVVPIATIWNEQTSATVGDTGNGAVTVDAGSALASYLVTLGANPGASGTVSVDGLGSIWNNTTRIYVGRFGSGTLNITNAGVVNIVGFTFVASEAGATGLINFGSNGGTLKTDTLFAAPQMVTGTGTINTGGLVTDGALLFDATHGVVQTLGWGSVTLNLNLNPTWGELGVGYQGAGSLTIADGVTVMNNTAHLGYKAGSSGVANISGAGSTWHNRGWGIYGGKGAGTMTVSNGGVLRNFEGFIGKDATGSGVVTIDGNGSLWTSGENLYVGHEGSGVLNITNRARVETVSTFVAKGSASSGVINFGTNGGTLTTRTLFAIPQQFTGTGTIATKGLVTDGLLVFDATHGKSQTMAWNDAQKNVTVNLDVTTGTGHLGAGYQGSGTLSIGNNIAIESAGAYLGYKPGAAGLALVNGSASTWTTNTYVSSFYVGYSGTGELRITNRGKVTSGLFPTVASIIGYNPGSAGTVTVDGTGSNWTNSGSLVLGGAGRGVLVISRGATVSVADATYVGPAGLLSFGTSGTLTTTSLYTDLSSITGTGNISTRGLVLDGSLVITPAIKSQQRVTLNGLQQNVSLGIQFFGSTSSVGDFGAGYQGNGSLTLLGVSINAANGYLGYTASGNGTVTVDGTGSTWNIIYNLAVGVAGTGNLNILNGGTVAVGEATSIGTGSAINFGAGGGTLTTSLFAGSPSQATGTGTIIAYGLLADDDITFNAATGAVQSVFWNDPGQNVNHRIDFSGTVRTSTFAGGINSTGKLTVSDGVVIKNALGYLGYNAGGNGTALITGNGSTWTIGGDLFVGFTGKGSLGITSGGKVTNINAYLGRNVGSAGTVTVDGAGSQWTSSLDLYAGYNGAGTLLITNGGKVSNRTAYLGYNANGSGVATVDGLGSTWITSRSLTIGSGVLNITNGGAVIVAGLTNLSNANSAINFGTNGGTLTTQNLVGSSNQITGTGTLNVRGVAFDGTFAFTPADAAQKTILWAGPQQQVTVQIDLTGTNGSPGDLRVGDQGVGTLTLRGGAVIKNANGFLGDKSGTAGMASVEDSASTWANSGSLYIGNSGMGTLTISRGGAVSEVNGYVGNNAGGSGWLSVDGYGSTLTSTSALYVGYGGTGAFSITNGAKTRGSFGLIGFSKGAKGAAIIDGVGSSWAALNTGSLTVGYSGEGTLTIRNGGSASNFYGYVGDKSGSTGAVLIDGPDSLWGCGYRLTVGNSGSGTVTVVNGGRIASGQGEIGSSAGATGKAVIDGSGSSWIIDTSQGNGDMHVGISATGTLVISRGGIVTNRHGNLGSSTGGEGFVSIDGIGSLWASTSNLIVGKNGTGVLNITNGGAATASSITINAASSLLMDVGKGSSLSAGAGALAHNGKITLKAASAVPAGNYIPITATTWTGTGTVTALGGLWNTTTHVFTISPPVSGTAGSPVIIDTSLAQQIVITDPTSQKTVWLGVQGSTVPAMLTFTAVPLNEPLSGALLDQLPGQTIAGGWNFLTSGIVAGQPVALSMEIGPDFSPDMLTVWHSDGATWTPAVVSDLSYDGMYANFTVTSFSSYAIVSVPEPSSLVLCGAAIMVPLLSRCRRRRPILGKSIAVGANESS